MLGNLSLRHFVSHILYHGTILLLVDFRPIAIEIPHFASLRGSQREIVVIRSDDGEVWREHKQACSDAEFLKQTNSTGTKSCIV